jgi:hypothetical protein
VGLRAGLDAVARKEIPYSCRESSSCLPSCSLVTVLTELSRLLSYIEVPEQSAEENGEICIMRNFIICSQVDQIKEDEMFEACVMHGAREMSTKFLFGKPERNSQVGRLRCRLEHNIQMNLK